MENNNNNLKNNLKMDVKIQLYTLKNILTCIFTAINIVVKSAEPSGRRTTNRERVSEHNLKKINCN